MSGGWIRAGKTDLNPFRDSGSGEDRSAPEGFLRDRWCQSFTYGGRGCGRQSAYGVSKNNINTLDMIGKWMKREKKAFYIHGGEFKKGFK